MTKRKPDSGDWTSSRRVSGLGCYGFERLVVNSKRPGQFFGSDDSGWDDVYAVVGHEKCSRLRRRSSAISRPCTLRRQEHG